MPDVVPNGATLSGVDGITIQKDTNGNAQLVEGVAFAVVHVDTTGHTHTGDTAETTLLDYTLPGNTVRSTTFVQALCHWVANIGSGAPTGQLKLYINNVLKCTITCGLSTISEGGVTLIGHDAAADYTGDVHIKVTGKGNVNGVVTGLDMLIVQGDI